MFCFALQMRNVYVGYAVLGGFMVVCGKLLPCLKPQRLFS